MTSSKEKLSLPPEQEEKHNEDWFGREILKDKDWENTILPNIEKHNYGEVQKTHQECLEKYPDEQEAVEAFFNALPALSAQKQLNGPYLKGEQRKAKIKELTEYQYLLTHFIGSNSEKAEKVKEFWFLLGNMASASKKTAELKTMKQGILGQVAISLALDKLGLDPHLATPDQDMLDKIDLQIPESNTREEIDVQIKSSQKIDSPQFFTSQKIYPTSVEIDRGEQNTVNLASQHLAQENQDFQVKIEEYQKKKKRHVESYLIAVPTSEMNPVTGCPSEKLVDFLKEKLEVV